MHKERRLFARLQEEANGSEAVRLTKLGNQLGFHEQTTREISRTWKNRGLVSFADPNIVYLTEEGVNQDPSELDPR